jgi:ubiquinone/menaquinone biosynthesis C-methylase UbiE
MSQADAAFLGSIPALYEKNLVPMLFAPYARDLCDRVAALAPRRILEIAAGTGAVTRTLRQRLPDAAITATDLNPAMLETGKRLGGEGVDWRQADACDLPFPDQSFDVVICQFGAMFFPDKLKAYAEARRVLAPGGALVFNVWDSLQQNDLARDVTAAVVELYASDPPTFVARTPHGYFDVSKITGELAAAGFQDIAVEGVRLPSVCTAQQAAQGFCEVTPMRAEIEGRKNPPLEDVTRHATEALEKRYGAGEISADMHAFVFTARAEPR